MKNSDWKRLMRSAYAVEPSERQKAFLKAHRRHEVDYGEMLRLQLRYMGAPLTLASGYVLSMLLGIALNMDATAARLLAALLPFVALLSLTGLGRSERCGMCELEAVTRFSLRMLWSLRLTIVGISELAVMTAVAYALRTALGMDWVRALSLAGASYLCTSFLCMLLIRRWHSENNLYGCAAIALGVSALMDAGARLLTARPETVPQWASVAFLSLSVFLTLWETHKCMNKEEYIWSFA